MGGRPNANPGRVQRDAVTGDTDRPAWPTAAGIDLAAWTAPRVACAPRAIRPRRESRMVDLTLAELCATPRDRLAAPSRR